jgi:UDP-N-acetylglucosamine 2-epimerase (non-hydrolysing)
MKIAPLMRAFSKNHQFKAMLVHTGQHYDENLSELFFKQLEIPQPDINLEVGSASHAVQTAEIMKKFEPVVLDFKPHYVLVVGDVNSTIGLRSFDKTMPEEINRLLTDAISDLLFATEQSAIDNLINENIARDKIHFVGNVMIDTLLANREKSRRSDILNRLQLKQNQYVVITLHRPSNVDNHNNLTEIFNAFEQIQNNIKLVFPLHPRTRKNIQQTDLAKKTESMQNLILIEPAGYLDFLCLVSNAALVMTDSGGIQEETTILGIPCMTLRENTERPVTITHGTNRLVHITTQDIINNFNQLKKAGFKVPHRTPELWDGKAAERIADIILKNYTSSK